jgi:hypothetical protein
MENNIGKNVQKFPSQKVPEREKGEDFHKRCIDAAVTIASYDFTRLGKSAIEKQLNYDIANGKLDESDFERAFNPQGIKGVNFPAKAQDYPIETQYFGVLKGEEMNRSFNWRVRMMNHDAVSEREEELLDELRGEWIDIINNNLSEQEIVQRLENFKQYTEYEYQDLREKAADRVLKYGWHTQKMKNKLSDGWYDVLINAEEHYAIDNIMNEPEVTKINPVNITTVGSGDSPYTEDSDMIIIDYWLPVGKVIDRFHDELTDSEIEELEMGYTKRRGDFTYHGVFDNEEVSKLPSANIIAPDYSDVNAYGGYYDEFGNVKVTHAIWSSFTEIMRLRYPDEDGEMQETYVAGNYKPKKEKGESGTKEWVRQFRHGYLIGDSMYKNMGALPRIGEQMNNPSICKPPVIGTIYTYNNQKPVSLLDRAKPYKYLYDVYMRRTELASARDKGVLAEMDFAKIPEGWEPDVWIAYAEMNGYYATDSFKTAKKGPAQGSIAGNVVQRGNETMNLSNAASIKTNMEMATYVKKEMSEILGVPPQRIGQMEARETKGGIDMSIEKSAHITEEWFNVHDDTKLRLLELYLETAKEAWRDYTKDDPKVLDFIDDKLIRNIYKLDGANFAENQYGLYIDHGYNTEKLLQKISSWGLAAMQNDNITLSGLINAERDHDVVGKIRKLEEAEKKSHQREMEIIRANQELKARETRLKELELKLEDKHKQQQLKLDKYEIDMEAQKGMQDLDRDGLRDSTELQREKLQQEYETQRLRTELEFKRQMQQEENKLKRKEMEQEMNLKLKELEKKYNEKISKGDLK